MQKNIFIEQLGCEVVVARRKGTRSIRIALKGDGVIRLSVPYGVTEDTALRFLLSKKDWIEKHKKQSHVLEDNMLIGKSHRLHYIEKDIEKPRSRISPTVIEISIPLNRDYNHPTVQTVAKIASEKALKKDAEHLLPQRIETIAKNYNLRYSSLAVKKLKSRWGSCSNLGEIVLNSYLIQLPWKMIDYVIIHELCHVIHHNHSPEFWAKVSQYLPEYKDIKKQLKTIPTDVIPSEQFF